MTDDDFLQAIRADPADDLPRAAYADWLEERGDARAELIRLQIRLRQLSPRDPACEPLHARERELRAAFPAYWLAKLYPPVWVAVGNVVDGPRSSNGVPDRLGTRLFRPGAKIYLGSYLYMRDLLDPGRRNYESVEVVGQHRKSRKWIGSFVLARATTNWRVRLLHHPGAIVRLKKAGWQGFRLVGPHEFACPKGKTADETLRMLFRAIENSFSKPTA